MTPDPVTLTLALALTLVAAYLVADVIARGLQRMLRAIIQDPHIEALFVDRPRRVVQLAIFLLVAAALVLPAMTMAGYRTSIGRNPEALADWALNAGLRIAIILVVAYCAIRVGTASARRFEREMSVGTGLDVIERTKRAQTLARLLQNTLSITVMGIAGLMILREVDVDITPVLTGAGIVGLAVGFGAQTLVRDIISGLFLIAEDQVRIGDVVRSEEHTSELQSRLHLVCRLLLEKKKKKTKKKNKEKKKKNRTRNDKIDVEENTDIAHNEL